MGIKDEHANQEIMQLDYSFDYSYFEKARVVQYIIKANTKFVTCVGGPARLNSSVMSSRWFNANSWAVHLTHFLNAHTQAVGGVHVWGSNVIVNNQRYEATFILTFEQGDSVSDRRRHRLKSWRIMLKP